MNFLRTRSGVALGVLGLWAFFGCGGAAPGRDGGESVPDGGTGPVLGRSWGPAQRLNSGDANSDPGYARVVIDSAGNAISVWQEETPDAVRNAVWASRYAAGGDWTVASTIDILKGNAIRPQISMNASGVAVAAFTQTSENTGGLLNVVTNQYRDGWGAAQIIDNRNTNGEEPRVALPPTGEATVVFSQSDDTWYRVWANHFRTVGSWDVAALLDSDGPSFWPEVSVGANGHVLTTWVQQTGVSTRALWARRNVDGLWPAPVLLSLDTGMMYSSIRVISQANGDVFAVWSQIVSGGYAVRASSMRDTTGEWTTPSTLNGAMSDAYGPEFDVAPNGDIVVVWFQAHQGVWANHFSAATGTWGGPLKAQPLGAPSGSAPKVAVDASGNSIAVWQQPSALDGTHAEIWGAQFSAADKTWASPFKVMTDPNAFALFGTDQEPAVAMNDSGDAVVVWYQRTDAPSVGVWARVYRKE